LDKRNQKPDTEKFKVKTGSSSLEWKLVQDRELIRFALESGVSEPALMELWERYKKRLYFYIHYRIHWNPASGDIQEQYVIEDLLQNIFFDVLENLKEYNPVYQVSTWIYTIANKHVMRYIREIRKHEARTLEIEEVHDIGLHTQRLNQPDDLYELKEFEKIVQQFINSLKRKHDQEVFILFLQNLNTKNISEYLHKTHDSIRSRLNRIFKLFKRFLQKKYPEYYNTKIISNIRNLEMSKTNNKSVFVRQKSLNIKG
jgi:RNA polymerase sigma factor (sigma-70 family)